jgi:hypothetical protein
LRRNCLLKHVIEGKIEKMIETREDEEEDISSYWMTLRKLENSEIERGSTTSHSEELALEEATDLSLRPSME